MNNNDKLLVLVGTNDDNFKIGQVYLFAGVKSSNNPNRYTFPRLYHGGKECVIGGDWFVDVTRDDGEVTITQPAMGDWYHFFEVPPERFVSMEVRTHYGIGNLSYIHERHHWELRVGDTYYLYLEDDILFINNKVYVVPEKYTIYNPLEVFYLTGTVEL